MDFTSSSTSWIYAYKGGSALNTDSLSAPITQHDMYGTFNFNLASANGGDSNTNPFTGATISDTAANTGSTSPMNLTSSTGGDTAGSSNTQLTDGKQTLIDSATIAHGIMGAVAFVLLFPSGAIIMRVLNFRGVIWVHVGFQILGYLVALALMETGVWIAVNNGQLMEHHAIIGLLVVCGLFFQPFLGLGHHLLFKRNGQSPNVLTMPHVWWGRILITLGIINGGLGLQLAAGKNFMTLIIVYCCVAGTVWAIWVGSIVLTYFRGNRDRRMREKPTIRRIGSNDSRMT